MSMEFEETSLSFETTCGDLKICWPPKYFWCVGRKFQLLMWTVINSVVGFIEYSPGIVKNVFKGSWVKKKKRKNSRHEEKKRHIVSNFQRYFSSHIELRLKSNYRLHHLRLSFPSKIPPPLNSLQIPPHIPFKFLPAFPIHSQYILNSSPIHPHIPHSSPHFQYIPNSFPIHFQYTSNTFPIQFAISWNFSVKKYFAFASLQISFFFSF